jgi:predicted choloylglycine hydrolase
MTTEFTCEEKTYLHITLEGSAYAAGHAQGEIHQKDPRFAFFCSAVDFDPSLYGYASLKAMQAAIERACPGLNEEIQGFSDACGVPPEKAFHYMASSAAVGGCSHMVMHPSISENGHVYVGRNYDLNPNEEDLCLYTTHIQGKARHIGFSTIFMGRLDGINEHGVVITMSAGTIPPQREKLQGFDFWVFVRAVLDRCHSVREAVELFHETPLSCYTNFLIADPTGEAVLIETAGSHKAIRWMSRDEPILISNMFYCLPEMQPDNLGRDLSKFTCIREAIQKWAAANRPHITPDAIKHILMKEYPDGCFCPFYNQGVGTLWSMVFDATEKSVQLTFGGPTHNPWLAFGIEDGSGIQAYRGVLPSKMA